MTGVGRKDKKSIEKLSLRVGNFYSIDRDSDAGHGRMGCAECFEDPSDGCEAIEVDGSARRLGRQAEEVSAQKLSEAQRSVAEALLGGRLPGDERALRRGDQALGGGVALHRRGCAEGAHLRVGKSRCFI